MNTPTHDKVELETALLDIASDLRSGRIGATTAAVRLEQLAPRSAASPIKAVTVTAPDGSPVAAPCAISGCQYTAASSERAQEPVLWGPEKQDYPGGPVYRMGSSTGAAGTTCEGMRNIETKPQSTYVPLTREQIEDWREVLAKKYGALSAAASSPDMGLRLALARTDIDTLCDMAVNSLLYAQEIDRLRSAPSAIRSTEPKAFAKMPRGVLMTLLNREPLSQAEYAFLADLLDELTRTQPLPRAFPQIGKAEGAAG